MSKTREELVQDVEALDDGFRALYEACAARGYAYTLGHLSAIGAIMAKIAEGLKSGMESEL